MVEAREPGDPFTIDNTPWVVVLECGHSRLPDANALDFGKGSKEPPEPGDWGRCLQCKDYRNTTEVKMTTLQEEEPTDAKAD